MRLLRAASISFMHPIGYYARQIPEAGIFDAYPGNRNFDNVGRVLKEGLKFLGPKVEEKMNIKPFGGTTFFPFYLLTKNPVKSFEDIKGLRIRASGGILPYLIEALGASVISMRTTEVYKALKNGMVDGVLRNLSSFSEFKEDKFCTYGVDIPLHVAGTPIFIGLKRWDTLDKTQKNAILDAADEITVEAVKYWEKRNDELMKKEIAKGIILFNPPPEFKAKWNILMAEADREGARKMSPDGADEIVEIIEKYTK